MTRTAELELYLLAAAARLVKPSPEGLYVVGKESVDDARDLLATDALFRELDRARGRGHARTRTHNIALWLAGPAWLRAAASARRAGHASPPAQDQRCASWGIQYESCAGYRKGQGGNRHRVAFTREALDLLDALPHPHGGRIRYFRDALLEALRIRGRRLHQGSAILERTPHERAVSRRSRNNLRAQRLREETGRRPELLKALKRACAHIYDETWRKGRLLTPRDRVFVARADVDDADELRGWALLVRRGQAWAHQDPKTGHRAWALNVRAFAGIARPEAAVLRAIITPLSKYVPPASLTAR